MQARVVLSIAARIGGRIICERFIELPDVKVSMWCDVVTGAIVCTEQALLVEERVEGYLSAAVHMPAFCSLHRAPNAVGL